jgi:hypothetical protein
MDKEAKTALMGIVAGVILGIVVFAVVVLFVLGH